jgi:hypothetical protein
MNLRLRHSLAPLRSCAFLTIVAIAGNAYEGPPLPTAGELMKKFVARSQEEDKANLDHKFGFLERRVFEELDKNGRVKAHRDQTFRLLMVGKFRVMRQIAKDGKPLTADEVNEQRQREQKALEAAEKKAAGNAGKKDTKKDDDDLKLDDQFLSHFRFTVIGREELNGRPAWVITVLPQPSQASIRSNAEKIFTHMQGKVWVDAEDYSLAKCDMHLTEPTSFYGVLGSLRQLDLLLQRQRVESGVWLNQKLDYTLDGRKLMTSIHQHQQSEYSDYKGLEE